jgi:eukaryotic translation initiation factor 2-alpha kinase 3
MSSAFFRRPGDSTSDSDSISEVESVGNVGPDLAPQVNSNGVEFELATTESVSTNASVVLPDADGDVVIPNADQHRDNMLLALLAEYYKTRAAEHLNASQPGATFDRASPEVQPVARAMMDEASKTLTENGIVSHVPAAARHVDVQERYLNALDTIALQSPSIIAAQQRPSLQASSSSLVLVKKPPQATDHHVAFANDAIADLATATSHVGLGSAHADLALNMSRSRPARMSHFESSFQQGRLIGKGGFGRVYVAWSRFDQKAYAVKKIPLSPRMTQKYQQGGHEELESVLREVRALAKLNHANIVRYHATWLEEPKSSRRSSLHAQSLTQLPHPRRRLLANAASNSRIDVAPADDGGGVVFALDSSRRPSYEAVGKEWALAETQQEETSLRASQLFTDDDARGSISADSSVDESVCVLHVQMSLYPLTLQQYLSPPSANARSTAVQSQARHCFHIVPTLRIILGVLCGLQYIHARGLVHRDIKPGNIFLSQIEGSHDWPSSEGFCDVGACVSCPNPQASHYVNPRIGDFGLVADLAQQEAISSPTSPSKAVGTEYYRPPRPDVPSARIDEKVDVYALGVIMIELLWQCHTATERMHVLRDLQKGQLPTNLFAALESEGLGLNVARDILECVQGMLDHDSSRRWGCQQIKERVADVLGRCPEVAIEGEDLVKVRSLNGTEDDSADVLDI